VNKALLRDLIHSGYDRVAAAIALTALAFVVAHAALLNVKEIFAGGARIGDLLYDFFLAYLASYVFYVIVVAFPRIRDRRTCRTMVFTGVDRIIGDEITVLYELGHPRVNNPSEVAEPDLPELCGKKNPQEGPQRAFLTPTGPQSQQITVWEAIRERVHRSQKTIDRLLRLVPLLDAELVQLLVELEGIDLFWTVQDYWEMLSNVSNEDMSAWVPTFETYHQVIRGLKDYRRRELDL
jgi:hypothetical protein